MSTSIFEPITLFASTTVAGAASAATGSAVRLFEGLSRGDPREMHAAAFILDVSAAATDAADSLDVAVQVKLDGTNWLDVVAFTQVVGNGGAKRHIGKIAKDAALTMFEAATSLSAGSIRNLFGLDWRIKYTIVDGGSANASFTFSVIAVPM